MGFPKYHVQIALLHAVMVRSLDAGNKHNWYHFIRHFFANLMIFQSSIASTYSSLHFEKSTYMSKKMS